MLLEAGGRARVGAVAAWYIEDWLLGKLVKILSARGICLDVIWETIKNQVDTVILAAFRKIDLTALIPKSQGT